MTAAGAMRRLGAAAVVLAVACGGSSRPKGTAAVGAVPSRATTAGDRVLRYLPAGADLLFELDLARVRQNAVIGEAVTRWLTVLAAETDAESDGDSGLPAGTVADLARAPLLGAQLVVLAAYGVGTEAAATATLVVGAGDIPGAVAIADGVAILAPPELARRAEAATAGAEPSLVTDHELLTLRTAAMPEKAEGAALRGAGRLDFDARVALAAATGAQAAPQTLSLWADVVDDAALIAVVDGADGDGKERGAGGARLAASLERVREQLLGLDAVRATGLGPAVRRVAIERKGDTVRVVALIGPKRLRRAAERLGAAAPSPSPSLSTPLPSPSTPSAKESPP
jgi:hypothetical protein